MGFTDKEIRRSKSSATSSNLPDGEGCILLVTSGGRQTLALKYRHEGKEKLEITKLTPQAA